MQPGYQLSVISYLLFGGIVSMIHFKGLYDFYSFYEFNDFPNSLND